MTDAQLSSTIRFAASDGWMLEGDIFQGTRPTVAVLVSAGTGFPRRFYSEMARYLAQQGAIVLTYDYRGIGGSHADDVATSGIDYPDWGRLDMPAAVDTLQIAAPDLPITHIGHSVGGHFIGLMPNHTKIARHAFLSVGTGFWRNHHLKSIPFELLFWWGIGGYSLMRYGFIKPIGGWQGEPLPPKLFKTWRRWSHRRSYFQSEYSSTMAPHHYDKVTAPIRSWVFSDDPIATPAAAKDLLASYPSAPTEIVMRTAAEIGVKRIGHEGAVRKGRERLWAEVFEWLNAADPITEN